MATLTVEIVTPETALWRGEANALVARSSDGDFTILPQHTETVGDIVAGVVRVQTNEGELGFAVHGGYFQVGPGDVEGETRATVLAGVAERTTDIDVPRAQAAKERLEAELAAMTKGDAENHPNFYLAQSALERAELRLRAAAH
ncbi:MAG: ATP synthase F1 subunit epsilon [Actinomycetales bacterium]|nr:ATP synthase F1 subunit epsilon [Actinomycetales bacterium]